MMSSVVRKYMEDHGFESGPTTEVRNADNRCRPRTLKFLMESASKNNRY